MRRVTPEIGSLTFASCFDGQRLIGEIDGWFLSIPDLRLSDLGMPCVGGALNGGVVVL